ncbi:MAG: response regulator [Oligoflexales bacterium]|nr:response regulator [Oligoflexales bacterium]
MKKKYNILLVDDDDNDVKFMKRAAHDSDFVENIFVAENGEDALEKINEVDLIFLDLNLPGIDGVETLSRIKNEDPSSIVVIFSTSSYSYDIKRSYEAGANAYLQKPFQLSELKAKFETICKYWLETIELPQKALR